MVTDIAGICIHGRQVFVESRISNSAGQGKMVMFDDAPDVQQIPARSPHVSHADNIDRTDTASSAASSSAGASEHVYQKRWLSSDAGDAQSSVTNRSSTVRSATAANPYTESIGLADDIANLDDVQDDEP